jgi:hypothetical protein
MSFQYSGTGALKTDYTRTGKRSFRGAIMDGVNSLTRYYLNNFQDGLNQDALDLFLGSYQPSLHVSSPFEVARSSSHIAHQKSFASFATRFTLALILLATACTQLLPEAATPYKHWSITTQIFLFFIILIGTGSRLMIRYGRGYTNKPLLRPQHP